MLLYKLRRFVRIGIHKSVQIEIKMISKRDVFNVPSGCRLWWLSTDSFERIAMVSRKRYR